MRVGVKHTHACGVNDDLTESAAVLFATRASCFCAAFRQALFAKHEGRERELLVKVREKYKSSPIAASSRDVSSTTATAMQTQKTTNKVFARDSNVTVVRSKERGQPRKKGRSNTRRPATAPANIGVPAASFAAPPPSPTWRTHGDFYKTNRQYENELKAMFRAYAPSKLPNV